MLFSIQLMSIIRKMSQQKIINIKAYLGLINTMSDKPLKTINWVIFLSILLFSKTIFAAQSITIWSSHQNRDFITIMADKFQKKHDVKISVIQLDPSEIKAEILLSAQDGGLPDIIITPSDFLGMHKLMNLSPIPQQWYRENLTPTVRDTVKLQGSYWGIPLIQGNFLLLYYNKKYVQHPATDFKDIILEKNQFIKKNIIPIGWNYNDMYYFIPFLSVFNGQPITDGKITLNTPAMVQALKYYRFLADQGIVNPECDYRCSQLDFLKGKSAYSINGDWAYHDLKNMLGSDLGVALLPKVNGKTMHPMASTFVLALPNYKQHSKIKQQLIKDFSEFVQQQDNQRLVYEKTQLLPISKAYYQELSIKAKGDSLVMFHQMALTESMPSILNMAIAWQSLAIGFLRYQAGATAEYSAAHMQEIAIEQLKKLDNK